MKTKNAEIESQMKMVPVIHCSAPVVPEPSRWEYSKAIELIEPVAPVHAPVQAPVQAPVETPIQDSVQTSNPETPVSQVNSDDVAIKLNEVIGLLMKDVRWENQEEVVEEEEDESEDEEDEKELMKQETEDGLKPEKPQVLQEPELNVVESEDEELEKIDDNDVDALEYEML